MTNRFTRLFILTIIIVISFIDVFCQTITSMQCSSFFLKKTKANSFVETKMEVFDPNDRIVMMDSTGLDRYRKALQLFEDEKYQGAIEEINKGLSLYDEQKKDEIYIALLFYKYLSYSWMGDRKTATDICKQTIEESRKIGYEGDLVCYSCKNYCSLEKSFLGKEDYILSCIQYVFKNKCVEVIDCKMYQYYQDAIRYKYGRLDSNKVIDELSREERIIDQYNDPLLSACLEYLRGHLLSTKDFGETGFDRSSNEKKKAIPYLKNAEKQLESFNSLSANYILCNVYYELSDIYSELAQHELAAYYYKKEIDLNRNYWREWGHQEPWKHSQYNSSGLVYWYIDEMFQSYMYSNIIEYCNEVLSDTLLNYVKNKDRLVNHLNESINKASNALGGEGKAKKESTQPVSESFRKTKKEIDGDSLIILYKKSILNSALVDSILGNWEYSYNNYQTFYEYLLENGDIQYLINFLNKLINIVYTIYDNDDYLYGSETASIALDENIDLTSWTKDDYIFAALRDTWHHRNGIDSFWVACHYLARAYLQAREYVLAQKYQQLAVDLVKCDWEYDADERSYMLQYNLEDDWAKNYLDTELNMYDWLAYIQLKAHDYNSAYKNLEKEIGIVMEICKGQLVYGAIDTKGKIWGDYNTTLKTILYMISDEIQNYPPFGNLSIECSSFLKGFLLNLQDGSYINAKAQGSEVFSNYLLKSSLERTLEKSYYSNDIDVSETLRRIGELNVELNESLDYSQIIEFAKDNVASIKRELGNNDVIIDFFAVDNSDGIEKKHEGLMYYNMDSNPPVWENVVLSVVYTDPCYYATILRKNWDCPKTIKIGRLSDVIIDYSDTSKDCLDYLFYQKSYSEDINALYRSISLGKFLWEKVIDSAEIRTNETVWFCPTAFLNNIAIEYLPFSDGVRICDKFELHRISTLHELHKPKREFQKGERCVAFGDIYYSCPMQNKQGKINSSTLYDDHINLTSDSRAIHNRNMLKPLSFTNDILKKIKRYYSNAQIIKGNEATEESFVGLSGNSPELLFIITHGYYFERELLTKEDQAFLYGNRNFSMLSDLDKNMYEAGLYLVQSSEKGTPNNGILTAKEISMCDFHNTNLAVIASCVSASGSITEEGVYGVQRGLKMAGVGSMLVSLWEVDAQATQLLMTEFLKNFANGYSKHKALKKAQEYVMNYESDDQNSVGWHKKIFQSPYYWAGFILID